MSLEPAECIPQRPGRPGPRHAPGIVNSVVPGSAGLRARLSGLERAEKHVTPTACGLHPNHHAMQARTADPEEIGGVPPGNTVYFSAAPEPNTSPQPQNPTEIPVSTNPSIASVLTQWSFDPSIVLGVVLTATIYTIGIRELAHRGRQGRSVSRRHVVYFALGLLSIVLAFESPIDLLSDQLLTIHMVQHVLLLLIAPPLLLLGKPIPVLVVGAPRPLVRWLAGSHARSSWFRRCTRLLISPFLAWPLFFGILLAWHLPALYDAALTNSGIHLLEHICFLGTGILFWWVIIQPLPGRPRLAYGWRVLYLFASMLPGTGLGLLFIVMATPIYPFYAVLPRLWGISVLDDQALAGNIMMVGGDAILLCALIPVFAGMMERLEEMELTRFAEGRQRE